MMTPTLAYRTGSETGHRRSRPLVCRSILGEHAARTGRRVWLVMVLASGSVSATVTTVKVLVVP